MYLYQWASVDFWSSGRENCIRPQELYARPPELYAPGGFSLWRKALKRGPGTSYTGRNGLLFLPYTDCLICILWTTDMKENIVHSIFDVMGSKETALTRSLLTILFKDKITLNRLIKFCFPKLSFHFTDTLLKQTAFHFEKDHSKYGRTDIEISNEHIHLILEAKIGGGKISIGQANKYSNVLDKSPSKTKLFVFLSELSISATLNKVQSKYPNIHYSSISWANIFKLLRKRKSISVNLIDEFLNSLLQRHEMKIYDIDIWAVVVRGEQELNLVKNRIYRNNKYHNPIMIASREWDKSLRRVVIHSLYPVLQVHDPCSDFAMKYNQTNREDYVYQLGKKIVLKNPIIKRFSQASAIAVTFKEL